MPPDVEEGHFDYKALVNANTSLESILLPDIVQIIELERQVENEYEAIKREENALEALEKHVKLTCTQRTDRLEKLDHRLLELYATEHSPKIQHANIKVDETKGDLYNVGHFTTNRDCGG